MSGPLTPNERLILQAAQPVGAVHPDYRAIPFGAWRALEMRGCIEQHRHGWAITDYGRQVITREQ